MKRKTFHLFVLAALILLVVPPIPAQAQVSQAVRVGLLAPINQLDPLLMQNSSEAWVIDQIFLGLVALDSGNNLQPELARSSSVGDNGRAWTFYLRDDVQWVDAAHNRQRPVISEDVVFTFERLRNSDRYAGIYSNIESIEVIDDFTVRFILLEVAQDFLMTLARPEAHIIPSALFRQYGDAWTRPDVIWGDGAYLLVSGEGSQVLLEANSSWWDAASVQVQRARVGYVDNLDTGFRRYRGGDLDVLELNPELRQAALQDANLAPQVHDAPFSRLLTLSLPITTFQTYSQSYLVKPYVEATYASYYGLGGLDRWQLQFNDPNIIIPETTRVLDDETLNALQNVSEDQAVLTFERETAQLSTLRVGEILVANSTLGRNNNAAPFGLLRRVENTFSDGTGRFIVETSPASLDEAVERGTITYTVPLTLDNFYQQETLSQAVPNEGGIKLVKYMLPYENEFRFTFEKVLYDDGSNGQVKAKGWVAFDPVMDLTLNLDINNYQLQSLYFSTTSTENAHVELTSKVDLASISQTYPLVRYTFMPQTVWIGWVPVVVTPQLTINVGVKGAVSVGISTGIDQNSTLTTGMRYDQGKWMEIKQSSNQLDDLKTDLITTAKAEAFAGPEFSAKLYGVAGPYARVSAYLKLTTDPSASSWWTLVGGVKLDLGIKIEIFSHIVASGPFPTYTLKEVTLAEADHKVIQPTDTPPSALPTAVPPTPQPSCSSHWWPPRCWHWWMWVIVVVIVIIILAAIL